METVDTSPTPKDVAADLKLIVHELRRWKRLPLPAVRGLPSIRFWQPPEQVRTRYSGEPNELICAAIVQRINEAITKMESDESQQALACIFTFRDPKREMKDRHRDAAEHYGVDPESFRTSSEKILLRELAEELFRSELKWAEDHLDPTLKQ